MKTKLTIILIMVSFWANAQLYQTEFFNGKIYDKTKKSVEGLISLRLNGGIYYKTNNQSKTKFFNQKHISGFEIEKEGELIKYEYKLIKKNYYKLLRVIDKNNYINLYDFKKIKGPLIGMSKGDSPNMVTPISLGTARRYTIYYIEKNNVTIKVNRNFEKKLDKIFSDCPSLIKQIKSEKFGKVKKIWQSDKIKEIVKVYNKCIN